MSTPAEVAVPKEHEGTREISLAQAVNEALAEELRQYAEKNLGDLPVFQRLALQSADAMARAVQVTKERSEDVGRTDTFDEQIEKASGERMARPMLTALRRLDQILCVEDERTVGRDNVVTADRVPLQLAEQPGRRTCAGLHVLVRRHLSGQHSVWYGGRCLGR